MTSSFLLGVYLAGAEFGTNVPGFLEPTISTLRMPKLTTMRSKGLDVIRLPFLWERVQRTEHGPT